MAVFPKGFEAPKAGGRYLNKLKSGETDLRITGPATIGYETWTEDNQGRHPHRKPAPWTDGELDDMGVENDSYGNRQKMFVAVPVIDRGDGGHKLWQISQAGIMGSLQSLEDSKKWGDLTGYDITVTRKGEGKDTKYAVLPNSKEPLSAQDQKLIGEQPINAAALFDNGDPFAVDGQPAPAKGPAMPPPTMGEKLATTSVIEVQQATCKNGQARYGIRCSNGMTFGTFSKTHAEYAKVRAVDQAIVNIGYAENAGRLDLTSIQTAKETARTVAAEVLEDDGSDIPF